MPGPQIAWIVGVGTSDGIGASVARRFAAQGLVVALTGRRADNLEAIARKLEQDGAKAIALPGDISHEHDIVRMAGAVSEIGELAVGVYNAGNNPRLPLLDMAAGDFEAAWRTACLGAFLTGREMLKPMLAAGRGTLIFTGATASLRGKPAYAAFASAKAGMRMVAQAFAREAGPRGVHVAHTIVDGQIGPGGTGALTGEAIAESYWLLHRQPSGAWSHEIDLRSSAEPF
jgi:NAD(P)-dependent dehydrogenase (short-subunit alcohol dehydrogenase family)